MEFEQEGVFVDDGDTEGLCFLELGASGGSSDHEVGFFGDATADLAATGLDLFLGVVAGHLGKRAGKDKGFAVKEVFSGEVGDDLGGWGEFDAEVKEVLDDLSDLVLVEEVVDRISDDGADIRDLLEVIEGGLIESVESSEVIGEGVSGGFADVTDAKRKEKASEGGVFAFFEALQEVEDGAFTCAFKGAPLGFGEAVEVREFVEESGIDGLFDQFGSEAIDVHGFSGDEVFKGAFESGRTRDPRTIVSGFAGSAFGFGLSTGTAVGDGVGQGEWIAAFGDDRYDFGDYIACTLDHDVIADADIFFVDLVLVVERGAGDDDASDLDRFEVGDRRQFAGASDLELDIEDLGDLLLGWELESDGPSGAFGDEAELFLEVVIIDFDDHAIDIVVESGPLEHEIVVALEDFLDTVAAA